MTSEGARLENLFGILLEDFRTSNIIARLQPDVRNRVPAQCSDPVKFTQIHGAAFERSYGGGFHALDPREQRSKLAEFLRQKFLLDPFPKSMLPEAGKKRKIGSWIGFYITDEEVPEIVERVMWAYDDATHIE